MTLSTAVDTSIRPTEVVSEDSILLVDDEPTNLSLLKKSLSSLGLKIRVATSGLKAIELTQKYVPKLVLLDVSMPEMDGFETCQHFKQDPKTALVPIIFITAFSEVETKVKGFSLGAVDYITKPFHVDEVIARVKVQLELQSLTVALRNKNEQLEQEVQSRKLAETQLQDANQQLNQSLQALKDTQIQLVQAEKMSGLGQMVAGIAHEINNPVNFIKGNIKYARNYFNELVSLLDSGSDHSAPSDNNLDDQSEEIDLAFIQQDFEKLLGSMDTGCNRLQSLVLSFRNFSRLDESGKKWVNLTEGVENTILFLKHRFWLSNHHQSVEIQRHYADIPQVYGYADQLNQVFLQILTNAIDFLENSDVIDKPIIQIITEMKDEKTVSIRIIDNGPGMTEDIRAQAFDPFFTTKPVGAGTGLGLSICYQIVTDQHKGQLYCLSEPGQGAEFMINIPLS